MEYQTLYETYYTMVYRLSLLILKNPQDAEDAAQTIFLKVIEKKPSFTDANHEKAWLLTVTRNYCRDIQRSFWHRKRTDMEQLPEQGIEPFDRQEGLLFEIIQTLPPKQREVVYLYYFEDYSIKEISQILERKESTIQSQLSAARSRLKKHISTSKAAVFSLALIVCLTFGGMAVDSASGGTVKAAIHEVSERVQTVISRFLSEKDVKVADEMISLPIAVYASDLVGIDSDYLALANERALLIYDRKQDAVVGVLDLQQMDCNYLNADSIATRIFMDDGKLYLFNETGINQELLEGATAPLPEFAYIYDISGLSAQETALTSAEIQDQVQKLNVESISENDVENDPFLTYTTDPDEIRQIFDRWEHDAKGQFIDTFQEFQDADFLNGDYEKQYGTSYSVNSLYWSDSSGKNILSCLVVDGESNYELYSKQPDGTIISDKLNMTVIGTPAAADSDADTSDDAAQAADPNRLPAFSYSGDDAIMATLCEYLNQLDARNMYAHEANSVYIPTPVIYGTEKSSDDIYVFCDLWSYWYYRNGNTLECESGGSAPARLLLHPDSNAASGYEVIEDLRTGDGSEYAAGIEKFCEGFPGMADRYFHSEKSDTDDIRTELIRMYVQDNDLDIKYYKDYGWDPVLVQ